MILQHVILSIPSPYPPSHKSQETLTPIPIPTPNIPSSLHLQSPQTNHENASSQPNPTDQHPNAPADARSLPPSPRFLSQVPNTQQVISPHHQIKMPLPPQRPHPHLPWIQHSSPPPSHLHKTKTKNTRKKSDRKRKRKREMQHLYLSSSVTHPINTTGPASARTHGGDLLVF